jgi:hypothetical protein
MLQHVVYILTTVFQMHREETANYRIILPFLDVEKGYINIPYSIYLLTGE